jgi:hypothetical protein
MSPNYIVPGCPLYCEREHWSMNVNPTMADRQAIPGGFEAILPVYSCA